MNWQILIPFYDQFLASGFGQFVQQQNLLLLAPEIILSIVILVSVVHLAFAKTEAERQDTWLLAVCGTVIALICLFLHYAQLYSPDAGMLSVDAHWLNRSVFYHMFQADLFSLVVRTFLVLGTLLVLFSSRFYVDRRMPVSGEFYVVMLSALLGGMLLSGATDLIMLFVALETLSISSYVLVGFLRGDLESAEAALKYLVYGGIATAVLLFGISLLYGFTGSTNFHEIAAHLATLDPQYPLVAIMSVLILAGFAFKLSVAPFHMWAPDVYQGAPTPVTAFLSVVSKIAGFAVVMRVLYVVMAPIEGWFIVLATVSVASMVIGNVVALTQRNIKRLLAYSTVAHAGYLTLGLAVLSDEGLASLLYYLIAYLFMNIGAFAAVIHFDNLTGRNDIESYAGLVRKRPMLTLIFSVMLLSLAGIPITAGFFGKFFLFQAVAQAGSQHLWLVIIALLTSTVSLYYYLNVIRLMVIAEPSEAVANLPEDREASHMVGNLSPVTLVLLLCVYATLILGILAEPFMMLARTSIREMKVPAVFASQSAPEVASRAQH